MTSLSLLLDMLRFHRDWPSGLNLGHDLWTSVFTFDLGSEVCFTLAGYIVLFLG